MTPFEAYIIAASAYKSRIDGKAAPIHSSFSFRLEEEVIKKILKYCDNR